MSSLFVSACLLGRPCRYDGRARPDRRVAGVLSQWPGPTRAVCPEELGGLGTPRPAAWLSGGDGAAVLDGQASVRRRDDDVDLTDAFVDGARRAADGARAGDVAVLKARSPSCGCAQTWIDGQVQPGSGVFAALLARRGVRVLSDEDPALDTLLPPDRKEP